MSNIDDYYQKLSQDLLTYIQAKEYQKVLDIIEDELQQPYIPQQHYINLLNTKDEVEMMLGESMYEDTINSLSKLQIWDKIYDTKNEKINLVFLNLFLSRFGEAFDDVDLSMMQKIFLDKKMPNTEKTILVSALVDLHIDHDFKYYNVYLKKTLSFNPLHLVDAEANAKSEQIYGALEKYYLKDPSKLQIAASLLQVLFIECFPNEFNFANDLVVTTITNVVDALFNQTEIIENEVSILLSRHIGYPHE